ncbi:MAG: nucleoside triphosphate pyrophosphohydrolase [Thermodesulfobacteriota bacterium]|nr:nucleoside triphosphate pyrophosphohydrolase [Thermodesulfobacteriota bacterium]
MKDQQEYSFSRIAEIIDRLRAPDGCLWDRQQKKEDVGKYLMEEAYEVIDAIDDGSPDALKEELGDVLFQILFLAKLSDEKGEFDISDVVDVISEKMIRRHPHVFGDTKVRDVEEILFNWKKIKGREGKKGIKDGSLLRGIPRSMPLLMTADKITGRASKKGFDWKDTDGVMEKIDEEMAELREAVSDGRRDRIENEIGDMFLSLVNLCRFTETDPENALRSSLKKFAERFLFIEENLRKKGRSPRDVSLEEMDNLWNTAKRIEKGD